MKCIFYFTLCLFSCITTFAQAPNADELKPFIIPISTNPLVPDSDLLPLRPLLLRKRVIGIGEATHGTHEFFTAKFRLIRFLISHLHYRNLALEANFSECRELNNYVLYGEGDLHKAIDAMHFWTLRTTEMADIISWIRSYNSSRPNQDRVRIYGCDMQFDHYPIQQIIFQLKRYDSVYFNKYFNGLMSLNLYDPHLNTFTNYPPSTRDSISKLLIALKDYTTRNNDGLIRSSSDEDVAYLNMNIRIVQQCAEEAAAYNLKPLGRVLASQIRDKCMSENVRWILDQRGPDSRVILWAHNMHVSKLPMRMGAYLVKALGDNYYALGLDFNKGSFRAVDEKNPALKIFPIGSAQEHSASRYLSRVPYNSFFLNIDALLPDKVQISCKSLFTTQTAFRSIAASFSPSKEKSYYIHEKLTDLFDGLIYVNETTPSITIDHAAAQE